MKSRQTPRSGGWFMVLFMSCVAALSSPTAIAQATDRFWLSASAPALGAEPWQQTHAWFVVPTSGGFDLVHVPPRAAPMPPDGGAHGAPDGSLRRVTSLPEAPTAIAAGLDDITLIFESRDHRGIVTQRRVSSVTAVRSGLGDLWAYEPAGRLRAVAPLPAGGTTVGAAYLGNEACVLLRFTPPETQSPTYQLYRLVGGVWREQAGMPGFESLGTVVKMFADRRGIKVASVRDGILTCSALAKPERADDAPVWTRSVMPVPSLVESLLDGRTALVPSNGAIIAVTRPPSGSPDTSLKISLVSDGFERPIAHVNARAGPVGAAVLDGQSRLIVVQSNAVPTERTLDVAEISSITGRVIYEGGARAGGLLRPSDFAVLALTLVGAMGLVLLLVLRRDADEGSVTLPPGTSLAEPGRRIFASALDLLLAITVASKIWGTPVAAILSPTAFVTGETWWVVLTALVIGWAIAVPSEYFGARTLGKAIAGCAVVSSKSRENGFRAPLWSICLRNAVKWILPPVAILGLLESSGRHQGDVLARTAVVIAGERARESDDE